jgi:hypothetical protein
VPIVKLPPKIQLLLTKFQNNIGLRRVILALLIAIMPGGLLIGALIAFGLLKKKRDQERREKEDDNGSGSFRG